MERLTEVIAGDFLELCFKPGDFDFVFDKGTLDCLLSGYLSKKQARKYLVKVHAALSENGVYFYVTNGKPENRLGTLKVPAGARLARFRPCAALPWRVGAPCSAFWG